MEKLREKIVILRSLPFYYFSLTTDNAPGSKKWFQALLNGTTRNSTECLPQDFLQYYIHRVGDTRDC